MDGDIAGGQVDVLSGADPLVGPAAIHLDGRDGGGPLPQRSTELLEGGRDVNGIGAAGGTRHVTFGVVGHGAHPQPDGGLVGLVQADKEREQPGACADAHHQESTGGGIQGAGVPDAALLQRFSDAGDDLMAGRADRFVDKQDPAHNCSASSGSSLRYGSASPA